MHNILQSPLFIPTSNLGTNPLQTIASLQCLSNALSRLDPPLNVVDAMRNQLPSLKYVETQHVTKIHGFETILQSMSVDFVIYNYETQKKKEIFLPNSFN